MGFLLCGLSIMGLTFGPMGALLPELFPTEVRYTRASFSYNVASILGASVAPYIATWLATLRVFLRRHASSSDGQPDPDRPAAAERNPLPVAVIPACGPAIGPHAGGFPVIKPAYARCLLKYRGKLMSLRRGLLLCIFSLAGFAIALYFGSPPQSNALWRIVSWPGSFVVFAHRNGSLHYRLMPSAKITGIEGPTAQPAAAHLVIFSSSFSAGSARTGSSPRRRSARPTPTAPPPVSVPLPVPPPPLRAQSAARPSPRHPGA